MLTWLAGKRISGTRPASCIGSRRPLVRALLHLESLETRCLLTVAPVPATTPLTEASVVDFSYPEVAVASSAPTLTAPATAAENEAADSINAFGLELYKALQNQAGDSDNLFVSPLSISTVLAMAYDGARGQTAAQMAAVLHLSGDPVEVARQFGALLTDLNSAGQNNFALSAANALWGQDGMQYLSEFLATMQNDYGGSLKQVDFINAPEEARQTINNWVAEQTNGKIQDLFPEGSINTLTRLVLANAIYFKGDWAIPFQASATRDATFTLLSGSTVQASTMHIVASYRYMQRDGLQFLEIPYAGGQLVMDVLLPPAGSGAEGLNVDRLPKDLNAWFGGLNREQVTVSLPKFTLTSQFNLGEQLKALGMTDAFGDKADFSGLTDSNQLKISQVVHKAFIGVDEKGTEAAAATGVSISLSYTAAYNPPVIPIEFNADHPFLFMIRDVQSGAVLFMGQMTDPPESDGNAPGDSREPISVWPPDGIIEPSWPLIPIGLGPLQDFFGPDFVGPRWPNGLDIQLIVVSTPRPAFPTGTPIESAPTDLGSTVEIVTAGSTPKDAFVGPIGIAGR